MRSERDTTIPVQTRMTTSLVANVDRLAVEFHLTRGNVITLLVAAAVQRENELLATYRALTASARERR
ncbi:hypothetical protein [Lentzea flaviverrucosa]|uniref:Ribbon-helix-helix protein, copG family n=1 Tax=Lentzea flaviverrucosa TaxID=200379 RepID=A0A1H9X9Z6_9PSEU|nr:hypothetical protein [Lentzea flaviverrucosa]RDI21703.1 hypothetical protein DFR72_113250 [Lentzea flaviverrucosa]SES43028.1 hypothetical protein SAMN05216195_11430 [Lentzea flaviverrucosa]